ncbi:MAG: thioesterase [Desulfobulbus propionicus]|nr:MAG: thioesterase [Desulfobulbus propionicus]
MHCEIPLGQEGKEAQVVTYQDTAASFGSGLVEVYATPAMAALMEKTCLLSILPFLPEGYGTVGTRLALTHTRATPIGGRVTCTSKLIERDRRRLVFEVQAEDERGRIGEGTHERFIIEVDPFMEKVRSAQ